MLVFEVRENVTPPTQQFFEGRNLQRSFSQNCWIIA